MKSNRTDIEYEKQAMRNQARLRRAEAVRAFHNTDYNPDHETGASRIQAVLCRHAYTLAIRDGQVIAGYLAIGDELDVVPSMLALEKTHNVRLAMPVVRAADTPLDFRRWQEHAPLDRGAFGTRHPASSCPACVPDIILIPLLAFDRTGYRMGWGGGFYDRTLEQLRRTHPAVQAIGVAYAAQEVPSVVRDAYDQPLDWIITEHTLIAAKDTA